jgi:hypothetical protein
MSFFFCLFSQCIFHCIVFDILPLLKIVHFVIERYIVVVCPNLELKLILALGSAYDIGQWFQVRLSIVVLLSYPLKRTRPILVSHQPTCPFSFS